MKSVETKPMTPVVATLTKVLHAYGDLKIQETMRFPDMKHAMEFSLTMLGQRVSRPVAGSAYTITAVEF